MPDVLDLIDRAIHDWHTSPDAMRWTPDSAPRPQPPTMFNPEQAEAFARGLSALYSHLRAAFNSACRALAPVARALAALSNHPGSRSARRHHRRPVRLCIDGHAYRRRTRGRQ
jgi:hypothetical protein